MTIRLDVELHAPSCEHRTIERSVEGAYRLDCTCGLHALRDAVEACTNRLDDLIEDLHAEHGVSPLERTMDADAALKIEQAIGTKAMMKLFMGYGDNIREAEPPAPGNAGGQFQQTTEGAKSEIANLFQDKDFMANYLSPNPRVRETAIAKMERLQKIAAGG